ncbi:MAG: NAD(P)-dependent oxidoreductase [Lentisphaeria bacterium]|nr:NAD(P)-dependent oxidoreductase [Lentisphaeria bacterium]
MKKILVFGATGNLGLYLVDFLAEHLDRSEYEIIALGRRQTGYFDRFGVSYIPFSIEDPEAYPRLPQSEVYAAVHLANVMPARLTGSDPAAYIRVNTLGTVYLLEYLRKIHADRILFTQTYADLAGHWDKENCLRNELPRKLKFTGDHAVYTISKCAAVDLIEHYHQEFGLRNFIFRLPNIYMYSPEMYYYVDGQKKLISYRYMIRQAMEGAPIEMWGNPDRGRDIVYVKDFCQMVWRALICRRDSGFYNVGTGVQTSLRNQIEGIVDVFSPKGKRSEIIPRPDKYDAMQYVMDIGNAREELGYEVQYDYLSYLKDYQKEMHSDRFQGI